MILENNKLVVKLILRIELLVTKTLQVMVVVGVIASGILITL